MFSIFTPVIFSYTGYVNTGVPDAPQDLTSFQLPISGARYIFTNHTVSNISSSGDLGSTNNNAALYSQTGGLGVLLGSWSNISALTPGMTKVLNFTVSGYTSNLTGVFLRQTTSSANTGIISYTVEARLVP